MIPPYTYAAARLAEERRKDTLREGEHTRLMRKAKPVRSGPVDRVLGKIGDLLVAGGQRLQERCQPVRTRVEGPMVRLSQ